MITLRIGFNMSASLGDPATNSRAWSNTIRACSFDAAAAYTSGAFSPAATSM